MFHLARGIIKGWDKEPQEPIFSRLAGKFHHEAPLKERVGMAIYRLKVQKNRLEGASMRMQQHDREIFERCVKAQMNRDSGRAAMYANECAEVRKIAKVTLQCELALEQVTLRLETVQEFGDIASLMGPVAGVVRSIRDQITGVMPEVGFELGEIGEMLNSVVIEVGEATGQTYDVEASSAEAHKVMSEAGAIAEQRMREKFPELPSTGLPSPGQASEQPLRP